MNRSNFYCAIVVLLCTAAISGCVKPFAAPPKTPEILRSEHVVVVVASERDTLAGLARTYLGSSDKAWRIAQYNGIKTVTPGDKVVIPLQPLHPGGLRPDGYQIVPVLLYDKVSGDKNKATTVSQRAFEGQMQFARESGCRTVSLQAFADFLDFAGQPPDKAIVITFDTTERWVYDIAYPILKRNGFSAAVFVTTGRVGKPGQLDWQALSKMAADGFDIGVSGHTGRRLAGLKSKSGAKETIAIIEDEILRSRQMVEKHLKISCRFFAYPYGARDDLLVALLRKHGYRAAFTRIRGDNPFFVDNFDVHRQVIGDKGSPMRFGQNLTTFRATDLK